MDKIFARRRSVYYEQNIKYLRYVFNDHFMLFLLIAIGALGVQYAQFLQHNHLGLTVRLLIVFIVSLISLFPGKVVTLMEEADSTFLLAKEEELKGQLLKSQLRSMIFPAIIIIVLTFIMSPLVKITGILWLIWFFILFVIKSLLMTVKMQNFQRLGNLDWPRLISYEQKRKTSLLKIFSLFTDVKGLSTQAKRRKYLDFLVPRKSNSVYNYLFWRTFLRNADYLGMSLRLCLLAVVGIIFIGNIWFTLLFVTLMNYLLIFQLLALKKSQDFQPLLRIYPINKDSLLRDLKSLIFRVLIFVLSLEFVLLFVVALMHQVYINLLIIMFFCLLSLLLFSFYLTFRLKK